MWFESLTGFREENPEHVRSKILLRDNTITSKVNEESYVCGSLETPSLANLRERAINVQTVDKPLSLREVVGDIVHIHEDINNAGSLFQVASQFNLLEMVFPTRTPEDGVDIYEDDFTQGPACAIAAGAGTIYRNYFADVNGRIGQSFDNQIDCLQDLGNAIGNEKERLWKMKNGYALPSEDGLFEISSRLKSMTEVERDELRQSLRIGIQWDTQVTISECEHLVSQAYCSALPVAYRPYSYNLWEEFAKLVLEASYEATFCAAIINSNRTGSKKLFLTLLGGGAFGNRYEWITAAIKRALMIYADYDLDITIVSFLESKPIVQELIVAWRETRGETN